MGHPDQGIEPPALDRSRAVFKISVQTATHRYVVERTFPAGALAGLDAATKPKVNATNASVGVHWLYSFLSADQKKTYCLYEAKDPAARSSRHACSASRRT